MTRERIYSALDLATDTLVALERHATPWTSWDVVISGPTHDVTTQFDSLICAAEHVRQAIGQFEDDDAPAGADVIEAIAAHFNDERIHAVVDDVPFLVNEWEWDDKCECAEHYAHRGWHTPGCPMDDGE